METEITSREGIGRFFITAFLLTCNVKRAEAAVLDGIESMDLEQTAVSAISRGEASRFPWTGEAPHDVRAIASSLPVELRRVLQLPTDLRRYFVLRMLVGLSRERCAALLGRDVAQVDEGTRTAITQLAEAAANEPGDCRVPLSSYISQPRLGICN